MTAAVIPLNPEDRTPPHNQEVEAALLGGLILDPTAIEIVYPLISEAVFYAEAHRLIYRAIATIYRQGKVSDLNTVAAWLADNKLIDKVGGGATLVQILERAVTSANCDQYAILLKEKYLRRELIRVGGELTQLGYKSSLPLKEVLDSAESGVFAVTQQNLSDKGFADAADIANTLFETIEALSQGDRPTGIPTGFYDLDGMTQGFKPGQLIVGCGRPAMGKSAWGGAIARHIAFVVKKPVALFTLEMTAEEIMMRMVATETGIEISRLNSGQIHPNEWEILGHGIANFATSTNLKINDDSGITVEEIRSRCRKLQAESGDLGLIVVDHLHLMTSGDPEKATGEIGKITKSLKRLAKELNVPILLLAQLNRSLENRNNKRPTLSDLRQSGSIEEDADIVIGLYRDEYYNPDSQDRGIAEVILLKHRNGPTGTVRLLFEGRFAKFLNLAGTDRPDHVYRPATPATEPRYQATRDAEFDPEARDRALAEAFDDF